MIRTIFILLTMALPLGAWVAAQSPGGAIAGLEGNAEYMSLLREDERLQMREDSVVNAVERVRHELRENPANRESIGQQILRMENQIFEIRTAKGRVVDRINTLEQEWVLANLNNTAAKPVAVENAVEQIPESAKVRNLIDNLYFVRQLPEADYDALRRAQRREMQAVEYVNRYFANHAALVKLAAAYTQAQQEAEALEVYGRYETLANLNQVLADSLATTWGDIFDNKSYAYNYLMDKLRRDEILAREEERLAAAMRELAGVKGEMASDAVSDYFLRKRVLVDYEIAVAAELGLTAARDSLRQVAAQVAAIDYRLPRIDVVPRTFIQYDSLSFSRKAYYTYQHPIPECRVYARGTIYRIQLGVFNSKRAADLFRGAYPLCYRIDDAGKWVYYAGGFATREEAEQAQKQLKTHGFVRPEIVVWNDGLMHNLSQDGAIAKMAYRVEISGVETLSDAVKQAIAQSADGRELSRVGQHLFVVGTFDDKGVADRVAAAVAQTDAALEIKVAEIAE